MSKHILNEFTSTGAKQPVLSVQGLSLIVLLRFSGNRPKHWA